MPYFPHLASFIKMYTTPAPTYTLPASFKSDIKPALLIIYLGFLMIKHTNISWSFTIHHENYSLIISVLIEVNYKLGKKTKKTKSHGRKLYVKSD